MNSKKKTNIIFFDIDGTILSHRTFKISDSTLSSIQMAKAKGNLIFINTGRTFAELDHTIKNIGFDGFVCGCGTYISYEKKVLLHQTLPTDLCRNLIHDLRTYQVEAVLEGSDAVYFDDRNLSPRLKEQRDFMENVFQITTYSWDQTDILFDKFCIWTDDADTKKFLFEKYKNVFDFIERDKSIFYEVIPKAYSKATGIDFLIKHLNIPHENTYAFGDGANDLEMLQYVKNSIGMGNCDSDVKKIVTFLTKDVDEDGIEYALTHFNLI